MVRLYTIQPREVLRKIEHEGQYQPKLSFVDESFIPAYTWLQNKMRERVPGYSSETPVWSWYWPKPDLRSSLYHMGHSKHEECALITFEVPENQVLLSDYLDWHTVLNRGYLGKTEKDTDRWYANISTLSQAEQDMFCEQSWEFCLRKNLWRAPRWKRTRYVQACTGTLKLSSVVSVRIFKSRYGYSPLDTARNAQ